MKRLTVSAGLVLAFFSFLPEPQARNPFNLKVKGDSLSCKVLVSEELSGTDHIEALSQMIHDSNYIEGQHKSMNSQYARKKMPLLGEIPGHHWLYRQTPNGSKMIVSTQFAQSEEGEKTVGLSVHFPGEVDLQFLDSLKGELIDRFDFLLNGGVFTSARAGEVDVDDYLKLMNAQDYLDGNTWRFEFDPMIFYFMDNRMQVLRADLSPEFLNEILEEIHDKTEGLALEELTRQKPTRVEKLAVRGRTPKIKASEPPGVVAERIPVVIQELRPGNIPHRRSESLPQIPVDVSNRPPSQHLSGPDLQQYELLRQAILRGLKNDMRQEAQREADQLRRRRIHFPMGDGRGTGL